MNKSIPREFLSKFRQIYVKYSILTIYFVLQSDTSYFSSSDWSTLDFLLTHVTNVLQLASKMYAS